MTKKKRQRKQQRKQQSTVRPPTREPATGSTLQKMATVRTRNKLKAALQYATLGIPILPLSHVRDDGVCSCGNTDCACPGKHLLYAGVEDEATTNANRIRHGWTRYAQTNIGKRVGIEYGHFVLDLDASDRDSAIELLCLLKDIYKIQRSEAIALSAGRSAEGSGLHLHYRAPVGEQLGTLLEESDRDSLIYDPPSTSKEVPCGKLDDLDLDGMGVVEIYGDTGPDHQVMHAILPPTTVAGLYRWLDLEKVWGASEPV